VGAGHGHGGGRGGAELRISRRVNALLAALVAALVVGVALGAVALWPGEAPTRSSRVPYVTQDTVSAEVVAVQQRVCPGLPEDRTPDGAIPATIRCGLVTVRLEDGPDRGHSTNIQVPAQLYDSGIAAGDRVDVVAFPADRLQGETGGPSADGVQQPERSPSGSVYAFADFSRELPLQILAVAFVLLVVAVARLRGIAALVGLGLGYATVLQFMLPALQAGRDPTLVALVGSVGILVVILYLAHGVSAKTTTTLLGTVAGLVITALLARWAVTSAHLNGLTGEDSLGLSQLVGQGTLAGVVSCGLVLAGLGILNDVTVTQSSAVWELRQHAPHLSPARLFASGMRIGRDHLASAVYTITFAYAGAALPGLLLIQLYGRPLGQVLTSGEIAEEVARTLVGGIGLVLAIPLTTLLAAVVAASGHVMPGTHSSVVQARDGAQDHDTAEDPQQTDDRSEPVQGTRAIGS
jgi:uncharacterized membrane protein